MTCARQLTHPMTSPDQRARNHAAIRAAGFGDKLDALIAMLAGHRAACEEVIRLADASDELPGARLLGGLRLRARGCILAIERTLDDPQISGSTHTDLGRWGPNGQGPRIDDMLRSARFHAKGN